MKIIKNVLSDKLYQECLDAIRQLPEDHCWASSSVTWDPYLRHGFLGSCIFNFVPEHLRIKIVDELRYYLPLYKDPNKSSVKFCIWQPMSGIPWHNDYGHDLGATIYLNEHWDINYGGIFLYENSEQEGSGEYTNNVNALIPQKNTMVINDRTEHHMVTPVGYDIPEFRYTIQIWAESKE